MSSTNDTLQATFTAKTLANALTLVRKGAKIRTGENWLETTDHRYGTDHVLIRVANGQCTLYTVSQPGEGQACTFVRCDRLAHVAYIDGELALPIRTLHDYVKTFSASDEIRIAGDDVRVVEDTPASHTYHTEANTYKRIRTEIPATYRDEHAIIVTSGRNRARIIGKPLASLAWMGDALLFGQVTPTEQAAADFAALRAIDAKEAITHRKPRVRLTLAQMRAACTSAHDDADALVDATITAITGEQYTEPALAETPAPTPIYAPAAGEHVHFMIAHENGTTTERVVLVHRVRRDAAGNVDLFRGFDIRRNKTRNFAMARVLWVRQWDGKEITDMSGRVLVPAA